MSDLPPCGRKWREFMKKLFATFLVVLGACTTTLEELESNPSTLTKTVQFQQNYQTVYRNLATTARRCQTVILTAGAAMEIDSELYSDLGFGEVANRLSNWGTNTYYWRAKIERTGPNSSRMTGWSGSTVNNSVALERIFAWASGDQNCTKR